MVISNWRIASIIVPSLFAVSACQAKETSIAVEKAEEIIRIDGSGSEGSWGKAVWQPMTELILGSKPAPEDFSGKFKLLWDEDFLYLLAHIQDDVLFDQNPDPLVAYWDDDCLEVFLDEDASGGEHQFNHNAFAYHVALDNQVVDIGIGSADQPARFILLNEHITSRWQRSSEPPYALTWELAIRVYDDSFDERKRSIQQPVQLVKGKKMGFMLAYCDNDGSQHREHFVGSHAIEPVGGDKNLGYKTADVFGVIELLDKE